MIRVDFVALLSVPLTPGVIYEVVVNAVGPGGTTASARSNTFAFTLSCSPTISPLTQSATAAGGTMNVTLSASAGCPWTAASNVTWIAVTSGAAGTGNGTIALSVAANTGTTSRTGTVTIGGNTFTVTQAGLSCSFALSPASQTFTAAGGSGTVGVTTTSACTWTVLNGSSWVTLTNAGTQTGSGSVGITAAPNPTTQSRTATLTIAGKSFVVTEQAASCSYAVTPQTVNVPAAGGTGSIAVSTSSTCAWTSASGTSWISLAGSLTGSGSATYTVGTNSGSTTRTGTVTVAGMSVTFTQAPLTTTLTPPSNLRIIR